MPSRTFSGQWEAVRLRFNGFRSWLGTPDRSRHLFVLLWPVAAVIIAILVIRRASTAKELADLISASASLAWSLVPFAIMIWFGREIRAIASRIRKGKFLGQEIELDELQAKTEAAEATSSRIVSATGSAAGFQFSDRRRRSSGGCWSGSRTGRHRGSTPRSEPFAQLGLMLLSAKIERAARELAADIGLDVSRRAVPLGTMIRMLVQAEQLSFEDAEALSLFNQVRNRIVHGHDAGDDEVARAINSGTRLLRLLLSRPRPAHQSDASPPPLKAGSVADLVIHERKSRC